MIKERGAESCYIDYAPSFGRGPFGKVLCTSVNDAVLHGLPHTYRVKDGDLVSFDFAVSVDGWVCDSAVSTIVGTPRDEDQKLIATTELALARAIEVARPGSKIGDIGAVIGETAREAGYSVNTQFGGPDGWTIRSADGSRGAHSEHTIAITDGDPIVMTARS